MSTYTYSDYVNASSNNSNYSNANTSVRVGFFKLKNDGDEALVRINCSTIDDIQFATVHQLGAAVRWMKVECLNGLKHTEDNCPLCKAAAEGNTTIGAARKVMYMQMLVSYRDAATGNFAAPVPVIWERPAGFSRELANKLRDYGPLKDILLKVTRNGAAGDMKTTYSLDYAVPTVFKPELIPADFSAFNNFKINRHSYWEKSADEINTFLSTGAFPEVKSNNTVNESAQPQANYQRQPQQTAYQAPVNNQPYTAQPTGSSFGFNQPQMQTYAAPVQQTAQTQPQVQPVQQAPVQEDAPQRNFQQRPTWTF